MVGDDTNQGEEYVFLAAMAAAPEDFELLAEECGW